METTISKFFRSFQMKEDKENSHSYGIYMKEALQAFAERDNKETAGEVYETFLDCYKQLLGGRNSSSAGGWRLCSMIPAIRWRSPVTR